MGSINKTTSDTSGAFPGDYRLPTAGTATAAARRRLSPAHGSIAAERSPRPEQGAALGDGERGRGAAAGSNHTLGFHFLFWDLGEVMEE